MGVTLTNLWKMISEQELLIIRENLREKFLKEKLEKERFRKNLLLHVRDTLK